MGVPADLDAAAAADAAPQTIDWSVPPAGVRAYEFEAPSGMLAAWDAGDPSGERVVLVGGATGSKEDFALLAEILVEAGYFVQTYDLAGQYQSASAGPSGAEGWTYDLFYDDMVSFLETGGPAHLLGFSFGGILGQLVAVRRPELVRSLTLLASPPLAGQVFRSVRWIGWLTRFPFFTRERGGGVLIWNVETNFSKVTPERLRFAHARLELTRRESVDAIMGLMMRTPDLRTQLRASEVPMLVVAGTHDLWRPSLYRRYAARIGAQAAIVETGHSPCETTPNQLAFHMLGLFERARERAGSARSAAASPADPGAAALDDR